MVLGLLACGGDEQLVEPEVSDVSIELTSSAFSEGVTIPAKYTCDGEDVSPDLKWGAVPEETKSIALIADDPDAPGGTWVHWVIYGLSAVTAELPERVPKEETLSTGARQGTNDFKRTGYGGPCPPPGHGAHRYFFKLYALDVEIGLGAKATKADLLSEMDGHILAQGQLMGRYERK